MKILFIENRHKTFFYEPIAKKLQEEGIEISWLIQNKEFTPNLDSKKYSIPYPNTKIDIELDTEIESLIKIDRQLNHFEQKDSSYFYYYNQKIKEILEEIKPNIVYGESTAFHELLTILNCKRKDILYLNPSSCRYPKGRFSFYKYDTLTPYSGSGEVLENTTAEKMISQIVNRNSAPDYMKLKPPSKISKINDKALKVKSYFFGEKYNTPNPIIKLKLEKQKKQNIIKWDEVSKQSIKKENDFLLLYPLQMQPEANIDVWGKEHRDQTKLIEDVAASLPKDCKLVVKPNPKSNYEISKNLISLARKHQQIEILHHNVKMDDVLPIIDLVITVTGTIAIECILSKKPIVTVVKTINNKIKSCIYINSLNVGLKTIIKKVQKGDFPHVTKQEMIIFISELNQLSYRGKISDPYTDASCIHQENINDIAKAFISVINNYDKKN
jgi:hypothetical protein